MKSLNLFARALGVAAGGALAACWAFAMWMPSAGLAVSGVNFVVALLLALLALFAAIASARGHAVIVVLMFLASFFPVGVALLGAGDWLRWIGRLDAALLIAGVLLWLTARHTRAASEAEAPR
jgi:hypothetical protein